MILRYPIAARSLIIFFILLFSDSLSLAQNANKFLLVDPANNKSMTLGISSLSAKRSLLLPDADGTILTSGTLGSSLILNGGVLGIVDNSSVQKLIIAFDGTEIASRHKINFITGSNVTLSISDDNANDKVDVTIASSGGGGGGSSFVDNAFEVKDDGDNSKKIVFQVSGVAASTIRTLTAPDVSGKIITDANKSDLFPLSYSASSSSTLFDLTNSGTASSIASTYSGTTDMKMGVYGKASANGAGNHVIGVWGDASDASSGNTGAIGVLATGGGNTSTGTSAVPNVALQLNDGELTMGRTTESPSTTVGSVSTTDAAAGSSGNYSADGPSGVVSLTGISISVAKLQNEPVAIVTINNKYAKSTSIPIVQIMDATVSAGTATDLAFSTQVHTRTTGSFKVRINVHNGNSTTATLTGLKLGYVITNPSK